MPQRLIITLFFIFASSSAVQAQLTWSEIATPDSVNQFALGSDGSIYITTNNTLYLSQDHGLNWKPIRSGSINFLTCDSNNAVAIYNDTAVLYSMDHGASWSNLYKGYIMQMAASSSQFYIEDQNTNLYCSQDYGESWSTLIENADGTVDDWRGLYCGAEDRAMATLGVCSCWVLFDSSHSVNDTGPGIRILADNSPPRNVVFARDGYISALYQEYSIRIAPNTMTWIEYDSSYIGNAYKSIQIPIGSPDVSTILSVDSFATYVSHDHGDTWSTTGTGIPASYPWNINVAFDLNGKGYALADGILYQTSFFQSSVTTQANNVSPIIAYPIPCKSSLNINANNVERVEIFDVLGVTRIEKDFGEAQSNPTLDVSGLPVGIYTVAVYSEGVRTNVRVVKE